MSTLQYLAKQGLLDRKPWYIYSVYIPIFCNCILYLCFAFVSIFIHPVFQFRTKNFKDRNSIKKKIIVILFCAILIFQKGENHYCRYLTSSINLKLITRYFQIMWDLEYSGKKEEKGYCQIRYVVASFFFKYCLSFSLF